MSLAFAPNEFMTKRETGSTASAKRYTPWWRGWEGFAGLFAIVLLLVRDHRAWVQMWAWTLAIFAGCKWLTWRRRKIGNAPAPRHIAYLLGWVGMDADAFLTDAENEKIQLPRAHEWTFAVAKLMFGMALLGLAGVANTAPPLFIGWIAMIGLVFVLHFGVGHLLSCFWRHRGLNAVPLMRWPIAASSLGDFWRNRWNTAFHDLMVQFTFRPFVSRLGARGAMFVAFLLSGLLHDAVISLAAGGGYGRPTLYFLLQGVGVLLERRVLGREAVLRGSLLSRGYAAAFVVAPAGLLFHPPFVTRVILPFVQQLRPWL